MASQAEEARISPAIEDEDEHEHEAGEDHAVNVKLTDPEAVKAAIRKQVEFYFSDANLPTDKHLLKQIKKDPDGYVPIKVVANFKRVKALSKDLEVVTQALASSNELVVQEDTKRVRRAAAVPDFDISDIQRRTVMVEHLPDAPTIESVTQMFVKFGEVRMVRICTKASNSTKLPSWLNTAVQAMNSNSPQFALVEFGTEDEANKAVEAFKEVDNWRTSLRVRHLLRSAGKHTSGSGSASASNSRPSSRTGMADNHGGLGSRGGSRRGSLDGGSTGGGKAGSSSGRRSLEMPSLPPVKTTLDGEGRKGRHRRSASGQQRPVSPYTGGNSRGTPPLSPTGVPWNLTPIKAGSTAGGALGSPRHSASPATPEVAAYIDKILSAPTSAAATPHSSTPPTGGAFSPTWRSSGAGTPTFGGFQTSQAGSPRRGTNPSTPTRLSGAGASSGISSSGAGHAVGVAAATAAAAAAAAAAALTASPRAAANGLWRGSSAGVSTSAPVTPLSGSAAFGFSSGGGALPSDGVLSSPEPKVAPWVPASRLAHMQSAAADATRHTSGSEAEDNSHKKPPRPRSSLDGSSNSGDGSRQRRQSWHASDPDDSKDRAHRSPGKGHRQSSSSGSGGSSSGRKQASSGGAAKGGRNRKSTIEAIREASCELDPAIAALAIATLSGTASTATAAESAEVLQMNRRRRSSFSGPDGVTEEGMGGGGGGSGAVEHGQGAEHGTEDGKGTAGHGKKKRAGRQRRKSTGSRRHSLDLGGDHRAPSPEGDKHQRGHASGNGGGAAGGDHKDKKHKEKKDYAAWACATVEFRAEASAAKHHGGKGHSGSGGGTGASSGSGAGSQHGGQSPLARAGVSPLWAEAHAGEAHLESHARIARGPDGTRGFSLGRGRPLASPPPLA